MGATLTRWYVVEVAGPPDLQPRSGEVGDAVLWEGGQVRAVTEVGPGPVEGQLLAALRGPRGRRGKRGHQGDKGYQGDPGRQGPPGRDVDPIMLRAYQQGLVQLQTEVGLPTDGTAKADPTRIEELEHLVETLQQHLVALEGRANTLEEHARNASRLIDGLGRWQTAYDNARRHEEIR